MQRCLWPEGRRARSQRLVFCEGRGGFWVYGCGSLGFWCSSLCYDYSSGLIGLIGLFGSEGIEAGGGGGLLVDLFHSQSIKF